MAYRKRGIARSGDHRIDGLDTINDNDDDGGKGEDHDDGEGKGHVRLVLFLLLDIIHVPSRDSVGRRHPVASTRPCPAP